INSSSLSIGAHSLNIRYKNDNGQWSSIKTSNFYRQPLANGTTRKIVNYEYWFDDNYAAKNVINTSPQQSVLLNGNINTLGLTIGQHNLHVRYQDDNGIWGNVNTSNFYRQPLANGAPRKIISYEYWFDDNYAAKNIVKTTPQQTLILNKNINLLGLTIGQHNLHIRYQDDNGKWGAVSSCNFYNTGSRNGNSTIAGYRYWFDSDNVHMTTAKVSNTVNPYNFSANINTSTLPNGQHTIHFQFRDYNNAWSKVTTDTAMFYTARPPTITAFTPAVAAPGTTVTITGINFNTLTAVKFGGVAASSFTIVSATSVTAVVGPGTSGSVSVTNPDGTFTKAGFKISSTIALLKAITLTPQITLTTTTGPGYRNYKGAIPNNISSIQVTANAQDTAAMILINGTVVKSGIKSQPIALKIGANVINIVVTATDGVTTKNYIITATRAGSTVATLSNLVLSKGTLSPAFAPATTSYTATVPFATSTISLTPTATDTAAMIKVNGTQMVSGTPVGVSLNVGPNTIITMVTATDGVSTKSDTVTVTRQQASGNALLNNIVLTPKMTVKITTGPGYRNYIVQVPNEVDSIKVTPTAQDPTAVIRVNGITIPSGAVSQSIGLFVGNNIINIVVTAEDGTTTKNYIISVVRSASSDATLSNLTVSAGMLSPAFAKATMDYNV
ncbi:MAG: cadherin-like beta sandwich domain-containing protein, partial [Mucilaginibacter sp.]